MTQDLELPIAVHAALAGAHHYSDPRETMDYEDQEYHFIRIDSVPEEVIEEAAFISYAEILSLEEGYLFSNKSFDVQNLLYYFKGTYPQIYIARCSDPTIFQPKPSYGNMLDLLDLEWLRPSYSFSRGSCSVVELPQVRDLLLQGYLFSIGDYESLMGWLAELGWAKAQTLPLNNSKGFAWSEAGRGIMETLLSFRDRFLSI